MVLFLEFFYLGGKTLWMRKIEDEKEINFAINQNFLHFKLFFRLSWFCQNYYTCIIKIPWPVSVSLLIELLLVQQ